MALIQLAHNAVTAKVYNAPREVKLALSQMLSYVVEGAEHTEAFKSGYWDGRSTFFDFRAGTFPAGFVYSVHARLVRDGHTVQLVRKPLPPPLGPERPVVDDLEDHPDYDYQRETVNRLLKYGMMIAQVATGGGKSRIAKLCYARIARPTLFLTTRSVLMYQMKRSFEETMKIRVGVLGDGIWEPCRGMNVGMVQTIAARLKEPNPFGSPAEQRAQMKERERTLRLLELFEFVILEEAHEAGGASYYDILRQCKNAYYRLALTATPFMRADSEANMRLQASAGNIGIRVTEKMLIDRGILAKPYFKYVSLPRPPKLFRTTEWRRAYKYGIVENEARNKHIVREVTLAATYGLTSMVLVQHKKHGTTLLELMKAAGLRAKFIYGEHEQEVRQTALAQLESGEIQVLIGSTILDVGVDVPAVGMIVLAGGGKAEVALRQRIGRGLRRKKNGPNVAFIVDFDDMHNKYLAEHAAQRRAIIEGTEGFRENILLPGQEFDYAGLGLKAA